VMPHMVNAQLFYGNAIYAMSKRKFDQLAPGDRVFIKEAGFEAGKWVKPVYESWVNEQIGSAVMKSGGSVRSLSKAERQRLIKSAAEGWNEQMDTACGAQLSAKLKALFKKYER